MNGAVPHSEDAELRRGAREQHHVARSGTSKKTCADNRHPPASNVHMKASACTDSSAGVLRTP